MSNRTALTHQQIQELLGAHALDAVDADERAAVDAHLATCDACRAEVDQHHETLVLLVTPAEPAGSLRDTVLRAAAGSRTGRADATDPPGSPGDAAATSIDAARARRSARPNRVAAVLAAAAAVVLVVGIGFAIGRRSTTPDLVALAAQAESQPGSRQITLHSPDGTLDARLTETADGTGYLHSDQLPALPAGQTYQLWAFSGADGKTPISLGVLGTNPMLSTFRADTTVSAFAVSREADGGSVAPTDPVVQGTV